MRKKAALHYHFSHYRPSYPNAADTNYYKKKFENIAAGILSGVCLTLTIVIFSRLI